MNDRVLHLCVIVLALAFIAGCSSSPTEDGGSGALNLSGIVNTTSYLPVSNADVTLGALTAKTQNNGKYSFSVSTGIKYILISHPSYTPAYRKVTVSSQNNSADIAFLTELDSKTTPISKASGGIARNTTSLVKMVFPSYAFSTDQNVVLTSVPKISAPFSPPTGNQFISFIVYVKPENAALSGAILSVPNITGTTQEAKFYNFNTTTFAWDFIANGQPSAETKTIDVVTDHMGWIAAIMPITPLPGWIYGTVTDVSTGTPISGANIWTQTGYGVSDQYGNYRVNDVPVGTAEARASALNYQSSAPIPLLITTETGTQYNFLMSSVPQGSISGSVYKGPASITGLSDVRVTESINGGETTTNNFGQYTLYNINIGQTPLITAYKAGYYSATAEVSVVGSTNSAPNLYLSEVPGGARTYEFTFASGTMEGFFKTDTRSLWHTQEVSAALGIRNYNCVPHGITTQKVLLSPTDTGYLPAKHDGSTSGNYLWYGQNTGNNETTGEGTYIGSELDFMAWTTEAFNGGISNYNYILDNGLMWGTIESYNIDLAGYTYGVLSFWTWWEVEGRMPASGYDTMGIYISTNGITWDNLAYLNPIKDPQVTWDKAPSGESYTSGGYNQPGVWVKHLIDLSRYSGKLIKLRFEFNAGDHLFNGYRGWVLDDIKIENVQYGIGGAMSVTSPFSNLRTSIPRLPRTMTH
jgi:hypothetical protein